MLSGVDVDRPKGIGTLGPALARRATAVDGRSGFVQVQPQQDQDEGDTNDRARSVQKGILNV